ncbi:hypothetical protein LCGC14_2506610, partial [marine sediment metagenome]
TWLLASPYPPSGAADGFTDPTANNTWTADQTYNDNVNLTFGTDGDVDIDFNGTDLVIQAQIAGTGHVRIEESTSGGGSSEAQTLNLVQNDAGSGGADIGFRHASSSPADSDSVGMMRFYANDSTATARQTHVFRAVFKDVTSTTMDSDFWFSVMNNVNAGSANTTAKLTSLGVWADAPSFEEFKQPERQLTTASVLAKLRSLDVYRFRGIGRPDAIDEERHISPSADAFYEAFKAGQDPGVKINGVPQYGIAARDVAGVALMAIQELIKENDKLKERLDALEVQ